jgi:hypothetical protein
LMRPLRKKDNKSSTFMSRIKENEKKVRLPSAA